MLLDPGNGDVVVARVTSRQVQTRYDVKLIEWKQALTFAAIGCTIAQVGNIAKNVCRTAVGCFNDKRFIEGKIKGSTDMDFSLTRSTQHCLKIRVFSSDLLGMFEHMHTTIKSEWFHWSFRLGPSVRWTFQMVTDSIRDAAGNV
ncbi:MAG: hypothetical protein C5S49_00145 [Candidatus Methanogaster sp.]|nr:MAG: hypothetical protein C5S49_00145 [ANME-2 cluster archaeon]